MSLTPSEHDVAAGYTETLMAVAVIRYPDLGEADIPWIELGGAGIGWPGDVDSWLRHDVPGWDDHDINYAVYVVPEADYRSLGELRVRAARELSAMPFLAIKEDVARVRAAAAGANEMGDQSGG